MSGDAEIKRAAQTMVVVADHALIRTSIVRFLENEFSGWDFVDIVSTAQLAQARGKKVSLVVLSVVGRNLESASVREGLVAVSREFPKAAIALLSEADDVPAETQALEMGVRGYFTTSLPIDVALAGLRLVLAGGVFCPNPLATLKYSNENGLVNGSAGSASQHEMRLDGIAGFTPREADVLTELQLGHSNKAIAESLNMSRNTVKMHLQHIMRKLHVQSRTEAALQIGALVTRGGV